MERRGGRKGSKRYTRERPDNAGIHWIEGIKERSTMVEPLGIWFWHLLGQEMKVKEELVGGGEMTSV